MRALLSKLGWEIDQNWVDFFIASLHIVGILAAAWIALGVSRRVIRHFRERMSSRTDSQENQKRIATLSQVFRYVTTVLIVIVAGLLVLGELGISIAPLLATAGVAGIAVGFGAQSLVKDYFTGFFLLLENQLRKGDVVEVAGKAGLVEEMTLRYVRLRDYDGTVHYIPHSNITTVTNRSLEFAYAVMDVGIAYRSDIDQALAVMRREATKLREDPEISSRILEDMEIAGVERWDDSAVVLRCRFKVQPLEQWGIRREFLKRLKYAFDRDGIEIPFPHLTLYAGQDPAAVPHLVAERSQA
jgi:Small-conductance mechanosensitive channel